MTTESDYPPPSSIDLSSKRFVIFGHAGHGKDTACEYLEETFGISFISSSEYAARQFLYEKLKTQFGYNTVEECYADRRNHRKLWYEEILAYNTPNLGKLGSELFDAYNVYCGIRDRNEFYTLKLNARFNLAIFIDASERLPMESPESMKLSKLDADIIIDNNQPKEFMYSKLYRLFTTLGYVDITE